MRTYKEIVKNYILISNKTNISPPNSYLSIEEQITKENGKMPKNSTENLFCCSCNRKTALVRCTGAVFLVMLAGVCCTSGS